MNRLAVFTALVSAVFAQPPCPDGYFYQGTDSTGAPQCVPQQTCQSGTYFNTSPNGMTSCDPCTVDVPECQMYQTCSTQWSCLTGFEIYQNEWCMKTQTYDSSYNCPTDFYYDPNYSSCVQFYPYSGETCGSDYSQAYYNGEDVCIRTYPAQMSYCPESYRLLSINGVRACYLFVHADCNSITSDSTITPPPEPSYEPMPSYEPPSEPSYEPQPSYEPPPEPSYEPMPSYEPPPEPSYEPMPSYEPYTPRPQPSNYPTDPEHIPCTSYECDESGLYNSETQTCAYFYPTQNATECLDSHDHYDPELQQCARWYEFPSTATDCKEGYDHIVIPEEDVNVCAQFYPALAFSCEQGQQHTYINNKMMCKEVRPAICVNSTLPTCPELGIYPTCEEVDTYLEDRHQCVHGILIEKDREGSAQSSSLETGSTVYTQEGEQIQCIEPYSYIIHSEQEYCVRFYEPIITECPFGFFPIHMDDGTGFCMSVLGTMCMPNITILTDPICPSDDPRCPPPIEPSPQPHPIDPICPSDDPRCPPIERPSLTPRPSVPVEKPSVSPHRIDPICPSDDPRCPPIERPSLTPRPSVPVEKPSASPHRVDTICPSDDPRCPSQSSRPLPSTTPTAKPSRRPCEDPTLPRCQKPESILNKLPIEATFQPLPSPKPYIPPVISVRPIPLPSPWAKPVLEIPPEDIPPYIPSRVSFPAASLQTFEQPAKIQEVQASLACTLRLPLEKIRIESITVIDLTTGVRSALSIDPSNYMLSSGGQASCYDFSVNAQVRRLQGSNTQVDVNYLIIQPPAEILSLNETEFATVIQTSHVMQTAAQSVGSTGVSAEVTVETYSGIQSSSASQTSTETSTGFPKYGIGLLAGVGGLIVLVAGAFILGKQIGKKSAVHANQHVARVHTIQQDVSFSMTNTMPSTVKRQELQMGESTKLTFNPIQSHTIV